MCGVAWEEKEEFEVDSGGSAASSEHNSLM